MDYRKVNQTWSVYYNADTTDYGYYLTSLGNVVRFSLSDLNGTYALNKWTDLLYAVTNYYNNNNYGNEYGSIIGLFLTGSDEQSYLTDIYFFITNQVDFLNISQTTYNRTIMGQVSTFGDDYYTGQFNGYSRYFNGGTENVYTPSYTYKEFAITNQQQVFTFDRFNCETEQLITIRGENYSYVRQFVQIDYIASDTYFNVSYGNPISSAYQTGYDSGYSNGNATGYVNGYDQGYYDGSNSVYGGQYQNAFNLVGNAFQAVGNVMSIEVFPNVTLGVVWSIPLVFVFVLLVVRLVKK